MADLNKFIVTNWCGVPHKFIRHADGTLAIDRFEEVLESGINTVPFYDYGYKTNCEALAACHKLGLKVILSDERIDKALVLFKDAFCGASELGSNFYDTMRGSFVRLHKVDRNVMEKTLRETVFEEPEMFCNVAVAMRRMGNDPTAELSDELLIDAINMLDTSDNELADVLANTFAICNKYYEAWSLLTAVVRDYAAYPALLGYHIVDEPNSSAFPALAEIREILSELDPAHESYINLFPNYASLEMLGNPSYYDHLEQFIEVVKPEILSYDHYHFIKGKPMEKIELKDEREMQIYEAAFQKVERAGFFDNIEDAMAVSQKTGVPFMIIILVVEHGPYRNLTEAEIRWEVFNSLCYGIKRLSYFTYWTPGVDHDEGDDFWHWKNGMIEKDGSRTLHYEQISRINRELQTLGDILLPHGVLDVFHFGKEPDGKVRYWQGSYGDVTSMTADRATVGFFEGGYVMIANKDYENAAAVTLTASEGKTLKVFDKTAGIWNPADNTLTLTLAAGDGELLKID